MVRKIWAAALILVVAAPAAAPLAAQAGPAPDPRVAEFLTQCEGRDGWSDPAPPFYLFGNTYGVGTCGMNALLVVSDEGLVLVDAGTTEAAPIVAENIKRLGFALSDVKWIVNSHEHWDHAGGIGPLQKMTGAKVAALAEAKTALESGKHNPIDPQGDDHPPFDKIRVDRVLADGDTVKLGALTLTAHATPAHSPGSTSWTWQSCEGSACLTVTYADSASTISTDEYRFSDHPDYVANVRHGLDKIGALDCDILVTPHPSASSVYERLAARTLVDSNACRTYSDKAKQAFDARLASEAEQTAR